MRRKKNYTSKSFYLKEEHIPLYEWLKEHAHDQDKSFTDVLMTLISNYKKTKEPKK